MIKMRNVAGVSLLAAGALALAGCGGSSDGEGILTLKITDSPVDEASEVVVVFTGVELKPADGEVISFDVCDEGQDPAVDECRKSINLLDLQNGATDDLLTNQALPAGQYNWIRLNVLAERDTLDGSYIKLKNGEEFGLFIPSGAQSGLKLVRPFIVSQQGNTDLVIDFDLRKSVIAPPGLAPNYILKPALRLVDNLLTGTVEGQVDLAALGEAQEIAEEASCEGGVYLFNDTGAIPDDQDGDSADGADPVIYTALEPDEPSGSIASYNFSFVETGDYTIAFTCNFDVDEAPDASEYDPNAELPEDEGFETMRWVTQDVVVQPDETVVVDYPFATL